jgi:hypothetical protein
MRLYSCCYGKVSTDGRRLDQGPEEEWSTSQEWKFKEPKSSGEESNKPVTIQSSFLTGTEYPKHHADYMKTPKEIECEFQTYRKKRMKRKRHEIALTENRTMNVNQHSWGYHCHHIKEQ